MLLARTGMLPTLHGIEWPHTHLGVCLLMMYCWGGAYRGSSRYWLGT